MTMSADEYEIEVKTTTTHVFLVYYENEMNF